MSKYLVSKYGGTSMAQPQIVADIIGNHPKQKIIVCSAPGKSNKYDHKLTDHLIGVAENPAQKSEIAKVIRRFEEITEGLDSDFRAQLLDQLRRDISGENDANFIISRGEYYSALALSERIGAKFVDATRVFFFGGDGKLNREKTSKNIAANLKSPEKIVIPGFYGTDDKNQIRLFKRGGSDRSGAIIAASLNWDYQNWTDIDGIMNADPSVIPEAKVISELTYEEVREGAHGGTGTLMGDSILDLEYGEFNTVLKNTFNVSAPGTVIKSSRKANDEKPVVAISARDDLLGLTIHDMGMRDRKGYLAKVLEILTAWRISIEHMPAAQDAITITFHKRSGINTNDIERQILEEVLVSPSASCSISPCGVVYLVGEKLRNLIGQHQVTIGSLQILDNNGIPVLAVMMHPDSPSVAIILKHHQTTAAQKLLFKKFLAE